MKQCNKNINKFCNINLQEFQCVQDLTLHVELTKRMTCDAVVITLFGVGVS
jgi:hypothetical protein